MDWANDTMRAKVLNRKSSIVNRQSLCSLWSAVVEVFLLDGFCEIDVEDVGEGGEPGEDIGEFFVEVLEVGGGAVVAVMFGDGVGEFADFLGEPEESGWGTAGGIGGVIAIADEFLEFGDEHGGGVLVCAGRVFWMWERLVSVVVRQRGRQIFGENALIGGDGVCWAVS